MGKRGRWGLGAEEVQKAGERGDFREGGFWYAVKVGSTPT